MKNRVITAIVIILIVAFPLAMGGIPLEILSLFIVATSAYEWAHVTPRFPKWPIIIVPAMMASVILARYVPQQYVFIVYALATIIFWTLTIFVEDFEISDGFYCISYFVILSLIYRTMGFLESNHFYMLTIVFATYGSDTGAWFVGRRYGKHKMNPRLSPKKSWEGFAGGIVFGAVLSLVVSFLYLSEVITLMNVILCICCPLVAEIGDLSFSAIKRYYKVKDFSNLLPGHGGILDRIDSLLMNILFCGILITIFM